MATPHNSAAKGDIAQTILLPGDPLRAQFISENFLKNPKMFNKIRGMFGFSGEFQGEQISVIIYTKGRSAWKSTRRGSSGC